MNRIRVTLPGIANVAILVACSALPLQGCGMFGGGEAAAPVVQHQTASRPNSDCARLMPLVSNPDGSLTRAELETGLKAEFKKWDKDGNGALSQAEVEPLNEYLRSLNAGASPVMDWNGDGKVDFQEFAGGWRTMFDLCDLRSDGTVTKAEMGRSPNVAPPRPQPTADTPQGPSPPKKPSGGGY
jgi:hypothetical protein